MGRKRTTEEIIEILNDYGYTLIEEFIDEKETRVVIIKDSCGFRYKVSLNSILCGYKPSPVQINNPFSIENISLWLNIYNDSLVLLEENSYVGYYDSLNLYCKKCDDYFVSNWFQIKRKPVCLVCIGKQVGLKHNLAVQYPIIASQWNYEYNYENPESFTYSSHEKVYWICSECGYGKNGEWHSPINNRTHGNGCPACSNPPKVITDKNRLSTVRPEIASEWHPNKNGDLTPDDISYRSNKRVWWLCYNGHEYFSSPDSRVSGRNCKTCSDERQESLVASELKIYFKKNYNAVSEYKILKNPKTGRWLPYDIYIPYGENLELNGVYIEIHGEQHFRISSWNLRGAKKNKTTPEEEFSYQKIKDKLKKNFAKKNGTYIEIDLRKIKTTEEAIEYIENILEQTLSEFG